MSAEGVEIAYQQMIEAEIGFHFSLTLCNFTPINRNFTMKIKINWLLIIALIALVFCVSYLISQLIIKKLYIDAAFVVAIVVLFPLLVYCVRHGK